MLLHIRSLACLDSEKQYSLNHGVVHMGIEEEKTDTKTQTKNYFNSVFCYGSKGENWACM